jgi:hypothetical protein
LNFGVQVKEPLDKILRGAGLREKTGAVEIFLQKIMTDMLYPLSAHL